MTCLRNAFLDVVNPLESKIHKNVCTGSWLSPESQVTAFSAFLSFLSIGEPFEPVTEAAEMVLGSACSCLHIKHMENSFTPLVQASAEFNIPSSNVSKASKNTYFLNPLQFASTTSSSFWHSSVVIIFHLETKL